jgi:hypothetical protein
VCRPITAGQLIGCSDALLVLQLARRGLSTTAALVMDRNHRIGVVGVFLFLTSQGESGCLMSRIYIAHRPPVHADDKSRSSHGDSSIHPSIHLLCSQ